MKITLSVISLFILQICNTPSRSGDDIYQYFKSMHHIDVLFGGIKGKSVCLFLMLSWGSQHVQTRLLLQMVFFWLEQYSCGWIFLYCCRINCTHLLNIQFGRKRLIWRFRQDRQKSGNNACKHIFIFSTPKLQFVIYFHKQTMWGALCESYI